MTNKRDKVRAQVKSRWYYTFWGTATVAVVAGQIYVGTSYRAMSKSLNIWFDTAIESLIPDEKPRGRYEPIIPPPTGDFRDYNSPGLTWDEVNPDDYIIWMEIDEKV
tara:strand:- start:25 stop:345 length:321 start_codon:yes stop_codon:yes gene_type:complete